MDSAAHIRSLVERVLESGQSPEVVCADIPDLLPNVLERLRRLRHVEAHLELFFPTPNAAAAASAALRSPSAAHPTIPGYQIEALLGSGGMGAVYRARHLALDRQVAVKMLRAGSISGPAERERLLREARSVAALCSANIIMVHDVGEVDGLPYFTMELATGGSLAEKLAGMPQPAQQAAALAATLAEAVQSAHNAGIVHRDLKPANILLTDDGVPKIADFGLARRLEAGPHVTLAAAQIGTPSYMAPEQALGNASAFCPAVDIYSLGAILYEMLTGRPPFRADSPVETARQVIAEEPAPPARLNAKIPKDLETICLKCLEKSSTRRYPTAADLAADLRCFLRGETISARRTSLVLKLVRWARRRPSFALLVALVLMVIVASAALAVYLQQAAAETRSQESLRIGRARQAVETALGVADEFRREGRWRQAQQVLEDARLRLPDANASGLEHRVERFGRILEFARDLEHCRSLFAEPSIDVYTYAPAASAYRQVFSDIGIGVHVPVDAAAEIVRRSPIRDELLVGLDSAAFAAFVDGNELERERWLSIARLADPDVAWRDQFRSPQAWLSRDRLLSLVRDAKTMSVPPPAHQWIILGTILGSVYADAEAVDLLTDAYRHDPSNFWINMELGNALRRCDRLDEACQFYRSALAIRPSNYALWTTLGFTLGQLGRDKDAIAALSTAVELEPRSKIAWGNLILRQVAMGYWGQARLACGRAGQELPDQTYSLLLMGDLLMSAERYVEAVDIYREAANAAPENHGVRQKLNAALLHSESDARWREGLDPMHGDADSSSEIVARARVFASLGQWADAARWYRRAIDGFAVDDAGVWFEGAAVQLLHGDEAEFRKMCEELVSDRKGGAALRPFLVARTCTLGALDSKLLGEAAVCADSELYGAGNEHWALTERGALHCRMGQPADAIPLFEQSITAEEHPGACVTNWAWLAIAYAELGDHQEAERMRNKAAEWLRDQGGRYSSNSPVKSLHLHNWLEAQVICRELDRRLSSADR